MLVEHVHTMACLVMLEIVSYSSMATHHTTATIVKNKKSGQKPHIWTFTLATN